MGKSTGSQALAVWMGHLRLTEWFDDYEGSNYRGAAVKMQAGVPVEQTYEEANARGLVVVSGVCPVRVHIISYSKACLRYFRRWVLVAGISREADMGHLGPCTDLQLTRRCPWRSSQLLVNSSGPP